MIWTKQINGQTIFYSGIDITVSVDVHVRKLRSAIVWRSISEMQRSHDLEARGLCRCIYEKSVRDEDETAAGRKRELSVHIGAARLVSVNHAIMGVFL